MTRFTARALPAALIIGFLIDAGVGVLCIAGQPLLQPFLGVPVKDPAVTAFLGSELLVAGAVYLLALRAPAMRPALLWLCALDQTLGVAIPAAQMALGNVPATPQTVAPMPFQLALVAVYVAGARQPR